MDTKAVDDQDTLNRALSLESIKDEKECQKVTSVVLIRGGSDRGLDIKIIKLFNGMTDNISYNSEIALYLLWGTVRTRLV